MTLLIGVLTLGLIYALTALGVFISTRIINFRDLTVEGAFTLGACACSSCLLMGLEPVLATIVGLLAGALAGAVTGVFNAKLSISPLLAGLLVMTALFSINLHIMGKSNLSLQSATTLTTYAERLGAHLLGDKNAIDLFGWEVYVRDLTWLALALVVATLAAGALYVFFRTDLGIAMRAAGDNEQMITALGVKVSDMAIGGLALSNGLVGLSGAIVAQFQGFADVQMGIGMLVWGTASVIIGESLVGVRHLGLTLTATVLGAILFRLLLALALRAGLDPNDLKLITAGFLLAALVIPGMIEEMAKKRGRVRNA